MKLFDFALLADENLHPDVVAFLRSRQADVVYVREAGLSGAEDLALIRLAHYQRRVIVTHDRDFGGLAVFGLEPLVGLVYLRPGYIDARFTIDTLRTISNYDFAPPFIAVARRIGASVRFRIRHL